jgi:GAF domain-containing protein
LEDENRILKERIKRLELIHNIGKRFSSNLELDSVLPQIVQSAAGITNAEVSALMLLDESSSQLRLRAYKQSNTAPARSVNEEIRDEIAYEILEHRMPLRFTSSERTLKVVTGYFVQAILYVPITVADQMIGVLGVHNESRSRAFSLEDEEFLQTLAEYAGIAIRFAQESERRAHMEILRQAMVDASTAFNLKHLGYILLEALERVVDYEKATFQIVSDPDTNRQLVFWRGFGENEIDTYLLRPITKDNLAKRVFRQGSPLILPDPGSDNDWDTDRPLTSTVKSWIGLPLVHNDQPLGLITLDHSQPGYYAKDLADLLAIFCTQTAVVIENFNLLNSERNQRVMSDSLSDLVVSLNTTEELDEVLNIILQKVGSFIKYETANIMLVEQETAYVRRAINYGQNESHIMEVQVNIPDYPTFLSMMESCNPRYIADVEQDSDWRPIPGAPPVRAWLGAPIYVQNQVIGFLNLNSREPFYFAKSDIERLRTFTDQIALAIRKSQLYASTRQQAVHLQIINDVSQQLSNKLDAKSVMQVVVDQIAAQLRCTHCALFVLDKTLNKLMPRVVAGKRPNNERYFDSDEGLVGWVYQNGESVMISDALNDERFSPPRSQSGEGRSMIAAPIFVGGRVSGVICADQDEYGWFNKEEQRLVEMLCQSVGIAIERAESLDLTHRITGEIVAKVDTDDVLLHIVSGAIELTHTATGVIYLLNVDENHPELSSVGNSFKYPEGFEHPVPRFSEPRGLTRTIISEKAAIAIDNIDQAHMTHPNININKKLRKHYGAILGMPLIYDDSIIGILFVHDKRPHTFTDIQRSLLGTLARLAAIAIHNSQLFTDAQRRNRELDALNQIGQMISSRALRDLESQLLETVYNQARTLMNVTNFYIAFWDEENKHVRFEFVREYGEPPNADDKAWEERRGGNALTEYVARTRQPLLIEHDSLRWHHEHGVDQVGTLAKSWLGVPMVVGDSVLGVIAVQSYENETSFNGQQKLILQTIASQTAIAVQNARLYAETKAHRRLLELLQQASKMLIGDQTRNMREILEDFLKKTLEAAMALHVAVVLINNRTGQIEDIVLPSIEKTSLQIDLPREEGLSLRIWNTREPIVIPDKEQIESGTPLHPLIDASKVRSALGLPWMASEESVIGVVWLYYDTPHDFSIFEQRHLRTHFDHAAFIYQSSLLITEQYRQREAMFSTLAHETATPLVSLAATANALVEEVQDLQSRQAKYMARNIIEQTQKLELQNETILAMFGRQNRPVSFRRRSVYSPIKIACELFENSAQQRGCAIQPPQALNGYFPDLEMSAHHLTLAFQNLISNAVKYSYAVPQGVDAERYIIIQGDWANKEEKYYTIRIQNYGVGIDDDEIQSKRIFQPFERGKFSGDRGRPGKGLGLTLVRNVVEIMHHGVVDVTSKPVAGGAFVTTFFVTLPLRQPKRQSNPVERLPEFKLE